MFASKFEQLRISIASLRILPGVQLISPGLTILLWAFALYLTTRSASKAVLATADLWVSRKWDAVLAPDQQPIDQQRAIQQHYLSYGVYIPIDDIVVNARQQDPDSLPSLLQLACGKGRAYVWVPLPFQLPVIGEKVVEWCLVKA